MIDYRFRPIETPFNSMTFWDYAQCVEKISIANECSRKDRISKHRNDRTPRTGRPANPRGQFLEAHPQHSTHMVRTRVERHVLSFVGRCLPHWDSAITPSTLEEWSRAMLILFKLWRTIYDLKGEFDSWESAFNAMVFDANAQRVMHNMVVESECEDARAHLWSTDIANDENIIPSGAGSLPWPADDWDTFTNTLINSDSIDFNEACDALDDNLVNLNQFSKESDVTEMLRALYRANLLVDDPSFGNHSSSTVNASDSTIEELNVDDRDSDMKMTGYRNRLQIL